MDEAPIALVLTHRHGIWRITKDGAFFGDYRCKSDGAEAAAFAAGALRREGRAVSIVIAPLTAAD